MATLDWHVTEEGGVTLVSLVVESETAERVRVTNCLDGPVWPPRRQGVPEEGWDEEGYEGTVEAGGRLLLGYASPADPAEPPARVTSLGPAEDVAAATAREVVRTLGDPTPPRDAVSPGDASAAGGAGGAGTAVSPAGEVATAEPSDPGNGPSAPGPDEPCGSSGERERNGASDGMEGTDGRETAPDQYAAVEAWLDGVADRLEDAERLARVSSVPEASEAVASVGGPDDIARLRATLQEDCDRLEQVAGRCEDLAARVGDVEVPVETLERLA